VVARRLDGIQSTGQGQAAAPTLNLIGHAQLQMAIACAMCETNDLGFFPPVEMGKWFSALQGKEYKASGYVHYLDEFCEDKRKRVLDRVGEKRKYLYRFADPLMQPFVLIHNFGQGKLNSDLLRHVLGQARLTYPADEALLF